MLKLESLKSEIDIIIGGDIDDLVETFLKVLSIKVTQGDEVIWKNQMEQVTPRDYEEQPEIPEEEKSYTTQQNSISISTRSSFLLNLPASKEIPLPKPRQRTLNEQDLILRVQQKLSSNFEARRLDIVIGNKDGIKWKGDPVLVESLPNNRGLIQYELRLDLQQYTINMFKEFLFSYYKECEIAHMDKGVRIYIKS